MEFDLLKVLLELGSSGAVIIVVVIFLRSNKERDAEWRSFFTTLNASNTADMQKLTDAITSLTTMVGDLGTGMKVFEDRVVHQLEEHDHRVDDRISAAQKTATVPRNRQAKG